MNLKMVGHSFCWNLFRLKEKQSSYFFQCGFWKLKSQRPKKSQCSVSLSYFSSVLWAPLGSGSNFPTSRQNGPRQCLGPGGRCHPIRGLGGGAGRGDATDLRAADLRVEVDPDVQRAWDGDPKVKAMGEFWDEAEEVAKAKTPRQDVMMAVFFFDLSLKEGSPRGPSRQLLRCLWKILRTFGLWRQKFIWKTCLGVHSEVWPTVFCIFCWTPKRVMSHHWIILRN